MVIMQKNLLHVFFMKYEGVHVTGIFLMLLNRSFTDHHLRCGGWLNFEFSKRGKTFGMGH